MKNAHIVCAFVWFMAVLLSGIRLSLDENGLVFNAVVYNIDYGIASSYSKTDERILYTIYALAVDIPTLAIIATTFGLMIHLIKSREVARRSGGDLRWQGLLTVFTTAVVYCAAILPQRIVLFINFHKKTSIVTLDRTVDTLTTLNIISNFYIYSITLPSFRNFVKSKAIEIWANLAKTCIRLR